MSAQDNVSGWVFCPFCGDRVDFTATVVDVSREAGANRLRVRLYDALAKHRCAA